MTERISYTVSLLFYEYLSQSYSLQFLEEETNFVKRNQVILEQEQVHAQVRIKSPKLSKDDRLSPNAEWHNRHSISTYLNNWLLV